MQVPHKAAHRGTALPLSSDTLTRATFLPLPTPYGYERKPTSCSSLLFQLPRFESNVFLFHESPMICLGQQSKKPTATASGAACLPCCFMLCASCSGVLPSSTAPLFTPRVLPRNLPPLLLKKHTWGSYKQHGRQLLVQAGPCCH